MATVRLGLDEQCSLNINREYLFSFIEPLCLLHISDSESCTSCFKLRIRNLASSYEPLFTQTWNMTNNLQSWVLFENAKLHFFKFQVLTTQMILLCANVTYYKIGEWNQCLIASFADGLYGDSLFVFSEHCSVNTVHPFPAQRARDLWTLITFLTQAQHSLPTIIREN